MSSTAPCQWHDGANVKLHEAMRARRLAEEQVQHSSRTHRHTARENITKYQNLHDSFEKKRGATNHLSGILQERAQSLNKTIAATQRSLEALRSAERAKDRPLELNRFRFETRNKRPSCERVRDPFELALEEEQEQLRTAQRLLNGNAKKTEAALNTLGRMLDDIHFDHDHKEHGQQIDEQCLGRTHAAWPSRGDVRVGMLKHGLASPKGTLKAAASLGLQASGMVSLRVPSEAVERVAAPNLEQEERRHHNTARNALLAKEAERASSQLGTETNALLQQTEADCRRALEKVERTMAHRIEECTIIKEKIKKAILDTRNQIQRTVRTMQRTETEIHHHEEPAELCTTRDAFRSSRKRHENIEDPVSTAMHYHKQGLQKGANLLGSCNGHENRVLQELERARRQLEADLADKEMAIDLDIKCQQRRV